MTGAKQARTIRLLWLGLLVVALAYDAYSSSVLRTLDGAEGDFAETFDRFVVVMRVRWVLSTAGWVAILLLLRRQLREWLDESEPRALQLAFWSWSLALVIDASLYVLTSLASEELTLPDFQFIGLAAMLATIVGCVAAVVHAARSGATQAVVWMGGIGMALFVALNVVAQVPSLAAGMSEQGATWLATSFNFIVDLAMYGAMALLPWIPRVEPGALPGALPDEEDARSQHLVVGGLWFAGGLGLTLWSMQDGGLGGRMVLAWGPMVYGLFRIARGLMR